MILTAGTQLGRYEIRSKIGEGGMGEVYLAEDTQLKRRVALKILPPELATNDDRMRRFVQEAQAAAALNHPAIAHIYEIGEHDGINFIAMEFVDGQTLRGLIHEPTRDLKRLLRYLQDAAEGLAKLVETILPDRSVNTPSDVATAILRQHSTPGTVLGTVGYMSPEQAQGRTNDIDQRSDIFSLGCILYEAITGRRAFEGNDVIDSLNKIIREPPVPIAEFNPAAPADLQRIVRRCLAKDADERYQTIKDVAIELKETRRELKTAGIDTTVPPPASDTASRSGATPTMTGSAEMEGNASIAPVSSAEYLISGILQHKMATGIVAGLLILLLVAGSIGIAYFFHARNTEAAIESVAVWPFANQNNDANIDWVETD